MNDRLFPAGVDWCPGIGWALVNDPYLVHFVHRWWAWVVVVATGHLRPPREKPRRADERLDRHPFHAWHQILLGIATVMTGVAIVARRASPGGRRPARRRDRVGRARRSGQNGRNECRLRLRDFRRRRGSQSHRPANGRGAARRLRQHPRTSIRFYRWEGAVQSADEAAGIFKTSRVRADALDRADRRTAQLRAAVCHLADRQIIGSLRRVGRGLNS